MTNTPAQDSGSCSVDLSMSEISESTAAETTEEVFTTVIETVEEPEPPSAFLRLQRQCTPQPALRFARPSGRQRHRALRG